MPPVTVPRYAGHRHAHGRQRRAVQVGRRWAGCRRGQVDRGWIGGRVDDSDPRASRDRTAPMKPSSPASAARTSARWAVLRFARRIAAQATSADPTAMRASAGLPRSQRNSTPQRQHQRSSPVGSRWPR